MNASSFDLTQEENVQTAQEKVDSESEVPIVSHEEILNDKNEEEFEPEKENVTPIRKEIVKKKPLAQANILSKSLN